jgi:tetratricopeptide (TPR) repeat protein
MKPTPDLFKLVKSLTKNEKRYVTLFLNSGLYSNNKNSLLLFKAISKQEQFDEVVLKKQLGKIAATRFSAEKNKLFDLILESLMFLYRDALPERRVVRNRLRAWFLFQKGLISPARKYLQKTQLMAQENEFFPHLALLAYHENWMARVASVEEGHFSQEKFHKRDQELLQGLSEDLVLHTLYTELLDLEKRSGNNAKPAVDELERLMKNPLLDPSVKLIGFTARMSRLEILRLYHSMKNNHREAYGYCRQVTAAFESSKIYLDQNYGRYCNMLGNQLMHAVLMRENNELPFLIQKMRKAYKTMLHYFNYDVAYNEFLGIHLPELISLRNRADAITGPSLLAQLEKDFLLYRPQLHDAMIVGFYFLFGTYHFYLGNLKKALHHFNDLIDSTDPEIGEHFQCMARLVKLLLHYDLGHYDLLPSLAQSAMRMLKKKERFGPLEKELLSFFLKPIESENKVALEKLLLMIRKHAPGYYSYGMWCDFEFEAWVKSHLGNKSLRELIC